VRVARALLLALLGAAASCGYTAGLVVPENARSVGVEVFKNGTLLRNLEVEVTSEVARSIADLVGLPLVPPDEADVVVRGSITAYSRRGGVRDEDNRRLETAISVGVVADLVRRRTGEVLSSSATGLAAAFVLEDNVVADDVPTEVAARDRAIENLADRLVLDLFNPLSYESGPEARSGDAAEAAL
jgi:hypothetical protein